MDGYCVMFHNPLEDIWNVAPPDSKDEYVFRTYENALDYGILLQCEFSHVSWKVIPFKKYND